MSSTIKAYSKAVLKILATPASEEVKIKAISCLMHVAVKEVDSIHIHVDGDSNQCCMKQPEHDTSL